MADFTKEEVLALAEEHGQLAARHLNNPQGYYPHNVQRNNTIATALRALAKSMDAEPVAWNATKVVERYYASASGPSATTRDLLTDFAEFMIGEFQRERELFAAPPASAPAEPVAVKGVDSQVMVAAVQMDATQKQNPEWLWYTHDSARFSFSRWSSDPASAPYVRADLIAPPAGAPLEPRQSYIRDCYVQARAPDDVLFWQGADGQIHPSLDGYAIIPMEEYRRLGPASAHVEAAAAVAADIDDLIERLLDAQQDINLCANQYMEQPLCDASALIDEVERVLRRLAVAPQPSSQAGEER